MGAAKAAAKYELLFNKRTVEKLGRGQSPGDDDEEKKVL
jgi:hypothetical protein